MIPYLLRYIKPVLTGRYELRFSIWAALFCTYLTGYVLAVTSLCPTGMLSPKANVVMVLGALASGPIFGMSGALIYDNARKLS